MSFNIDSTRIIKSSIDDTINQLTGIDSAINILIEVRCGKQSIETIPSTGKIIL